MVTVIDTMPKRVTYMTMKMKAEQLSIQDWLPNDSLLIDNTRFGLNYNKCMQEDP